MTPYTIQKTINQGYGLTHNQDGKTILVEGGLPGEQVSCKVTQEKKQYNLAKIKKIIKQHPERIDPPCKYIRECGGCNLQHASYALQTEIKTAIIKDILQRSSVKHLDRSAHLVEPCIPSPTEYHYRQRIRLHIDSVGRLGFLKRKSNDIVQIDHCLLAQQEINTVLKKVKEHPEFEELLEKSTQLQLLFNPQNKRISLILSFTRKPRPADIKRAERLVQDIELIESFYFQGDDFPLSSPINTIQNSSTPLNHSFEINEKNLSLCWEAGGFCQVNLLQNVTMIKTALDFADLKGNEDVLDLYCGMGNFSIPFAQDSQSVTGFEGQGAAIRAAKINSKDNGLTNTAFYKKPVHKACDELIADGKSFNCTIIDPPRQGAPDLAKQLSKLTTDRIIYISCDPATLSRDLGALVEFDFQIEKIQPIDMFPQTHHIETIVLLKNKAIASHINSSKTA